MTNAELIKALQCASHFALYQDCYDKNCYANSGKGLYCNIPKLMADASDALEADDKKIAELMPKEGVWQGIIIDGQYWAITCSNCHQVGFNAKTPYCPNCGAKMRGANDEQIH